MSLLTTHHFFFSDLKKKKCGLRPKIYIYIYMHMPAYGVEPCSQHRFYFVSRASIVLGVPVARCQLLHTSHESALTRLKLYSRCLYLRYICQRPHLRKTKPLASISVDVSLSILKTAVDERKGKRETNALSALKTYRLYRPRKVYTSPPA